MGFQAQALLPNDCYGGGVPENICAYSGSSEIDEKWKYGIFLKKKIKKKNNDVTLTWE